MDTGKIQGIVEIFLLQAGQASIVLEEKKTAFLYIGIADKTVFANVENLG